MSADWPTGEEEAAYDRGFEAARDYWQPIIEAELIAKVSGSAPSSLHNLAFDTGRVAERESILKLLEEKNNCNGGLSNGNCTCTAIAIIKGANK